MIALKGKRRLKMQGFTAGQRRAPSVRVCSWDVATLLRIIKSEREMRSRESKTRFALSPVEDFDGGLLERAARCLAAGSSA